MDTPTLFSYYREQQDQVLDNLPKIKMLDEKAIHQLRVAIKKIRAYSVFLYDITNGQIELIKELSLLNKVFKAAGKIRDSQVQRQLLIHYEQQLGTSFSSFYSFLEKREHKQRPIFKENIEKLNSKVFNNAEEKLIATFEGRNINDFGTKLNRISEEKIRNLRFFKKHEGNIEHLHDFRKLFKELMYTYKFGKGFCKDFQPQLPPKKMNDFSERLGHWHDQTVMLEFLSKFKKKHKDKKSVKHLHKEVEKDSLLFMDTFEEQLSTAGLIL